jgi:16S rRNA (uracil1498-N3)-methyltransferase
VRLTRVYVDAPLAPGEAVTLNVGAAAHVSRVLRLAAGARLTVFNGQGGEYAATIDKVAGGQVQLTLGAHFAIERESALALTLAQGISRAERMDLVVQKATELGVTQLVPLLTVRSVVRLDAKQAQRRLQHWRAIAVAACEQSGRNRLPHVAPIQPLADYLTAVRTASDVRLLFSPAAPAGLESLAAPLAALSVLIGPEGGLGEEERAAAVAAGFQAVRLGPRILRTETCALAALALLQRQFGDL